MGFFTKEQTQSKSRPDGKVYSCFSCGLYQFAKSPKIAPVGSYDKKVLLIAPPPSYSCDKNNKPWSSKEHTLINTILNKYGFVMDDCLSVNVTNCIALDKGKHRLPNLYELTCCNTRLMALIRRKKPKLIITFGIDALQSLIETRWGKKLGGIEKWHGWTIPDRELNAWICPVFDPYMIFNAKNQETANVHRAILEQDLSKALSKYNEEINFEDETELIRYPTGIELLNILKSIYENKTPRLISFDFETNTLKPYVEGAQAKCVSISERIDGEIVCYSFILGHPTINKAFGDILSAPWIKKTAHNLKFEDKWSRRLFSEVNGWAIDTMIASHILDNRRASKGLKFQTYVNFGLMGYDGPISSYLKADDSNSFNTLDTFIKKFGIRPMLTYCGLDSIYGLMLAEIQIEKIGLDIYAT